MSRPNVTDATIDGLEFARACVLDQRVSSHDRKDHKWDDRYRAALDAIDFIVKGHTRAAKNAAKVVARESKRASKKVARRAS